MYIIYSEVEHLFLHDSICDKDLFNVKRTMNSDSFLNCYYYQKTAYFHIINYTCLKDGY